MTYKMALHRRNRLLGLGHCRLSGCSLARCHLPDKLTRVWLVGSVNVMSCCFVLSTCYRGVTQWRGTQLMCHHFYLFIALLKNTTLGPKTDQGVRDPCVSCIKKPRRVKLLAIVTQLSTHLKSLSGRVELSNIRSQLDYVFKASSATQHPSFKEIHSFVDFHQEQ